MKKISILLFFIFICLTLCSCKEDIFNNSYVVYKDNYKKNEIDTEKWMIFPYNDAMTDENKLIVNKCATHSEYILPDGDKNCHGYIKIYYSQKGLFASYVLNEGILIKGKNGNCYTTIEQRYDKENSEKEVWFTGNDVNYDFPTKNEFTVYTTDAQSFIRKLKKHERLAIRFQDANNEKTTYTFDLKGAEAALKKAEELFKQK